MHDKSIRLRRTGILAPKSERIRRLRALIGSENPACELEVDGGIDEQTARADRQRAQIFLSLARLSSPLLKDLARLSKNS